MMPGCSNNIRINPNSLTKAKRNNVDSSHQESCHFNACIIGKVVKATGKKRGLIVIFIPHPSYIIKLKQSESCRVKPLVSKSRS